MSPREALVLAELIVRYLRFSNSTPGSFSVRNRRFSKGNLQRRVPASEIIDFQIVQIRVSTSEIVKVHIVSASQIRVSASDIFDFQIVASSSRFRVSNL